MSSVKPKKEYPVMTTATIQQPPSLQQTSSPQRQPPRPSLALAADPERALHLAPNFQPDIDVLIAEGVITFGVKGSGKSNLLALLAEQLGRFLLPQLIIDTEREYHSLMNLLPRGVIATANRCPGGYDILHKGLQVILDLQSWDTDEAAALTVCQLIDELFTATSALAQHERIPCIIHLDEAGYWLPQEAVTYLSKETRKRLADAFHKLATRGRKQGLTPLLYTQSISEVTKSAIRQAGIKVLMRQTLDIDLSRYCQYIQGATSRTKKALTAFPSGRAVVILPDGSQHKVQFHQRHSEHVSQTPQAQAALVKFASMQIDVATIPMRDLTALPAGPAEQGKPRQSNAQAGNVKQEAAPRTATQQVYDLLAENPMLGIADLTRLIGCSRTHACRARLAFFERHPEQHVPPKQTDMERVYDLLRQDPTLRPVDLVKRLGCHETTAAKARRTYLLQHPEQRVPAPRTATQQVYDLLAENPMLRAAELARLVGCDPALASKARRAYVMKHPQQEGPAR